VTEESAWRHVAAGGDRAIFEHGARMIAVTRKELRKQDGA
jgi:hypothetical protein